MRQAEEEARKVEEERKLAEEERKRVEAEKAENEAAVSSSTVIETLSPALLAVGEYNYEHAIYVFKISKIVVTT